MSEPAEASLGEDGEHAKHACLGQNACICDLVLPGDAQESCEVTHVKGIQPSLLVRVQGPGLAVIEKSAQHAGLIYPHLVVECQHSVVPPSLC